MIRLEAILPRKPAIWFAGEPELMQEVGNAAAGLIKARIEGPNVDADGRPLPRLSRRIGWFTTADDVRVESVDGMKFYRSNDRRELDRITLAEARDVAVATRKSGKWTYDTEKRTGSEGVGIYWPGYEALKGRKTGSRKRGASFSGSMWASLKLYVGRKRAKDGKGWVPHVRFAFTGSEVQGYISGERYKSGKPKKNRVYNRLKGRLLQYSKRNKDGSPQGAPDFYLRGLNEQEVVKITEVIKRRLRLIASNQRAG